MLESHRLVTNLESANLPSSPYFLTSLKLNFLRYKMGGNNSIRLRGIFWGITQCTQKINTVCDTVK